MFQFIISLFKLSNMVIESTSQYSSVELSTCMVVDLQLPMQSVPIPTKVVSSIPANGEAYVMQYICEKVCQ